MQIPGEEMVPASMRSLLDQVTMNCWFSNEVANEMLVNVNQRAEMRFNLAQLRSESERCHKHWTASMRAMTEYPAIYSLT